MYEQGSIDQISVIHNK